MIPPKGPKSIPTNRFREIFEQGKSWRGRHLGLWALSRPADGMAARTGIVVSRKSFRRAVDRNRWRRRVREIIREEKARLRAGFDLVFLVRKTAERPGGETLRKEIAALLEEGNLIAS